MQFKIVVPPKCVPGQTLRVHISDGTEANVRIPHGLFPGDSFVFEVPTQHMKNPGAFQKQQQQQQQSSSSKKKQQANNGGDDNGYVVVDAIPSRDDGSSNKVVVLPQKSFLDREIIDWQDFFLALLVGLLVGSFLVLGFVLGVLWVTEDIYRAHPIEKPKTVVPKSMHKLTSESSIQYQRMQKLQLDRFLSQAETRESEEDRQHYPNDDNNDHDDHDDEPTKDGVDVLNEALDRLLEEE